MKVIVTKNLGGKKKANELFHKKNLAERGDISRNDDDNLKDLMSILLFF